MHLSYFLHIYAYIYSVHIFQTFRGIFLKRSEEEDGQMSGIKVASDKKTVW